ncbi:calcium-binding protein P-like [Metopolophium dirhodum]|uniref:calcium-binding protein P-like n=1 Tax=Metopolophium dirhodum TaxID=44670 RepID=UPI002990557E|nr:calcium-binding protein P-like [Metopolophium dirhodum]
MMCFKAILLVSAIVCLISAEYIPLKERIFKCKLIPFKKHHSIFDSILPSIMTSPADSAVPDEYTVPEGGTTFGTEPVPVPTAVPVEPHREVQNPPPQEVQHPPQPDIQYPPQLEVQYPPQSDVQYPPQPSVQYPPQPEVQYPPKPDVQYPTQPEVQYPVTQEEGQPPAAPQQVVQNTPLQQPLYPPQHEGQRPAQHHVEQNLPSSNEGLYPPQHNGQYYQLQNTGMYYPPPPPNYQGFTTNNVPYNYPVYGQNVLRSVKSLDGQTYPLHQLPYRVNMFIRQPNPYYNAPQMYGQYAAPQYNYVPQMPRTAQALTGKKAKSP